MSAVDWSPSVFFALASWYAWIALQWIEIPNRLQAIRNM